MSVQKFSRERGAWDAVPRNVSQDTELSAEALGVWLYLYNKPDDWQPREADVRARFSMGRDRYYRIMAELREVGLVVREDVRDLAGKIASARLHVLSSLTPENPKLGKPGPLEEKRDIQEKIEEREEGNAPKKAERGGRFSPPTPAEVAAYGREIGFEVDGAEFVDHYAAKGWLVGRTPMKDWKAAVRTWRRKREEWSKEGAPKSQRSIFA